MQRFFDILFSGIALVLLSPFFLLLIFILRVTAEGEIFFLQSRVGRGGKDFKLYKFVTMLKDSPKKGTGDITVKNDSRILPIGRFLRKTKINELPQLINVFIGDMSVIGPRPQTKRCFNAFSESAQNDIIKLRPGLSGIGSVIFRSEEDMLCENVDSNQFYNEVIMPYKGKLESWYVRNSSVWNYLLIILLTMLVILNRSTRIIFLCYSSLPRPPVDLNSFIDSDYYE